MADFLMPSLGADMDQGTLVEWLVKPGDDVHKGEVIAVVDTAKAAIEVESFVSGTVRRLIVEPGTEVPVGTVLAEITEPGLAEGAPTPAPAKKPAARKPAVRKPPATKPAARKPAAKKAAAGKRVAGEPAAAKKPAQAATLATAPMPPASEAKPTVAPEKERGTPLAGRPHAAELPAPGSPLIRHLAAELGVDLATVHGTGHGGLVTRQDVEHAARARRRVTPLARRVAADLGVDLASVTGTGPDAVIREEDVRRAAVRGRPGQQTPAAAPAVPRQPAPAAPVTGPTAAAARTQAMRQVTARLMARSKREIPHYYLSQTIDLNHCMAWLHDRNRELEVSERLVPAALLLKAAAVAARRVPQLNGFWVDDEFRPAESVHLGVAISLRGGGLVTPAIHDAADMSPFELMNALRDLVARARTGRLRGSELTDATITVTNLGDQGVELVYGVIYPPQVALVGFGKVAERPVAVDGLVGARPIVMTTLAADHRATDGYTGARYLSALSDLLQHPEDM